MRKGLKISIAFFLLAVIAFVAVPKVYVHKLLGHNHTIELKKYIGTSVSEDKETQDCEFEKFDTPVYYTVFKFILNFIPVKEKKETSFYYHSTTPAHQPHAHPVLRGPPEA